jgi:hypothetical protein
MQAAVDPWRVCPATVFNMLEDALFDVKAKLKPSAFTSVTKLVLTFKMHVVMPPWSSKDDGDAT